MKKNTILTICFIIVYSIMSVIQVPFTAKASASVSDLRIECYDGRLFPIFESDETIKFYLKWLATDGSADVAVNVYNYFGDLTADFNENVDLSTGQYEFTLPNQLIGHYSINANIGGGSLEYEFSVVNKLSDRRNSDDSVVTLSAMSSHGYKYKVENPREFAKTLALQGITHVREFNRIDQTYVNGEYKDYGNKICTQLIDAYNDYGMKVLFMVGGIPASLLRDDQRTDSGAVPYKLLDGYRYIKSLCETYNGKIDTLEIMNETNIGGNKYGADKYAAFLKSAAIAVKDSNTGINVANAALTHDIPKYRETLYQNDINDYIDVFSFHEYATMNKGTDKVYEFPPRAKETIDEANSNGLIKKPKWLTETGIYIPISMNETEPSKEQKLAQTRYAPTAIIEAASYGTDKAFWFIPGYMIENHNILGTMSTSGEPYGVYNSISACSNILGNAKYAGKVTGLDEAIKAHVFYDSNLNESVVALWSNSENQTAKIYAGSENAVYSDIMGNEEQINSSDGIYTLSVGKDICYLRFVGKMYSEFVQKSDIQPTEINPVELTDAQKIVIQPEFVNADESKARTNGYIYKETENELLANVYNFNNFDVDVNIKADGFKEWGVLGGEETVHIPAMGKVTVPFTLTLAEAKLLKYSPITISGEYDGMSIPKSTSYIMYNNDYVTKAYPDFTNAGNWQMFNVQRGVDATFNKVDDSCVKFDYKYSGDSLFWAFPFLSAPDDKTFFADTYGIKFECKTDKPIKKCKVLMYVKEYSGREYSLGKDYTVSPTEWDTVVLPWDDLYVPFTIYAENYSLNLNDIESLRIGVYTTFGDNVDFSFYVKDLSLIEKDYSDDIMECTDIQYSNGELTAQFESSNVPVSDVEFTVDSKSYKAECLNNTATAQINLPYGEQNISIKVINGVNRVYNFEKTVNVDTHSNVIDNYICKSGIDYSGNPAVYFKAAIKDVKDVTDEIQFIYSEKTNDNESERTENYSVNINNPLPYNAILYFNPYSKNSNKSLMAVDSVERINPLSKKIEIPNNEFDEYVNYVGYTDFYNPLNWKKNIMTNGLWSIENVDDTIIKFSNYIPKPGWSFPFFTTNESIDIDEETKAISFYYKFNQNNFGQPRIGIYILENDGEEWVKILSKADGSDSYNQALFPLKEFSRTQTGKFNDGVLDVTDIKNMRVGLFMPDSLSSKGFDFYIKDFGFVK